jgi:hypothetical protein
VLQRECELPIYLINGNHLQVIHLFLGISVDTVCTGDIAEAHSSASRWALEQTSNVISSGIRNISKCLMAHFYNLVPLCLAAKIPAIVPLLEEHCQHHPYLIGETIQDFETENYSYKPLLGGASCIRPAVVDPKIVHYVRICAA